MKICGMGQKEPQAVLYLIIMLKQSSLKKYIPNLNGSYNENRLCHLIVVGLIAGSNDAYTKTGIGTHIHSN
jgi:hypothetical protein